MALIKIAEQKVRGGSSVTLSINTESTTEFYEVQHEGSIWTYYKNDIGKAAAFAEYNNHLLVDLASIDIDHIALYNYEVEYMVQGERVRTYCQANDIDHALEQVKDELNSRDATEIRINKINN